MHTPSGSRDQRTTSTSAAISGHSVADGSTDVATNVEIFQFISNRTLLLDVVVPTLQSLITMSSTMAVATSASHQPQGGGSTVAISVECKRIVIRLLQEITDCQEYWSVTMET